MSLVPAPAGRIAGGEIIFEGRDLTSLPAETMRAIRGAEISMIFQDPMTSLNPVFRVGAQIAEAVRLHESSTAALAAKRAVDMLAQVGIPMPGQRARDYPHQLSGGMRQRVMIAIALACRPKLLIADEPTTALDVTIQAQILRLIAELQNDTGAAVIMITHDLGVIASMAQHVIVMYAGRVFETAPVKELFRHHLHPYTEGLLASIPRLDQECSAQNLATIRGMVPRLHELPAGCKFHNRCEKAFDRCLVEEPGFFNQGPGHQVRCWLYAQ